MIMIITRAENGVSVYWKDEEEVRRFVYTLEDDEGELDVGVVSDFLYNVLELLDIRESKGRYSRNVLRMHIEVGDKYQVQPGEEIYEDVIYKIRKK